MSYVLLTPEFAVVPLDRVPSLETNNSVPQTP